MFVDCGPWIELRRSDICTLADTASGQTQMITLTVITVLTLVPIAYYAWAVRQRLGARARLAKAEAANRASALSSHGNIAALAG